MESGAIHSQISLPRLQELQKLQEHLQQKPIHDQLDTNREINHDQQMQQLKSSETQQANNNIAHEKHAPNKSKSNKRHNKKKKTNATNKQGHPYKGKNIDISV